VHPNFRLIPVLLGLPGDNQKLVPAELKQLLADNSRQSCVARRGRWGPRTPGATTSDFKKRIWFLNHPNFYDAA